MEEFRQLKEALQKMPSFKAGGAGKGQQQFQVLKEQPMAPANSQLQLVRQKVWYSQEIPGRRVLQGFCGFSAWGFELEGTELVPRVCSCPFFLAGFSSQSGESPCRKPAGITSLWGSEAGRWPSAAGPELVQ